MASRPKRTATSQPALPLETPPPAPVERIIVDLPDWFDPPAAEHEQRRRPAVQGTMSLEELMPRMYRGEFVLPTYQRGPVWTRAQQIALFDSMMRGLPIGTIVFWESREDEEYRAFPGCPPVAHKLNANVVVDGQQRLLAILAGARGELGVRWSDDGFGPRGYLAVEHALGEIDQRVELFASIRERFGKDAARIWVRAYDQILRYIVQVVWLPGSREEAEAAYRRMAAGGTPHTAEEALTEHGRQLAYAVIGKHGWSHAAAVRYAVVVETSGRLDEAIAALADGRLLLDALADQS